MYTRRGVVDVRFDDCDNTLAGSSKFTHNSYNHSDKLQEHSSYHYEAVYLQH